MTTMTLQIDGAPLVLEDVVRKAGSVRFTLNGTAYHFHSTRQSDGSNLLAFEIAPGIWQRMAYHAFASGKATRVALGRHEATIREASSGAQNHAEGPAPLSPPAPMPGVIRQLLVAVGESVSKGQPLVVMEAMKLQMTLAAGGDATVEAVRVAIGDMVSEGAELITLTARP